MWHSVSRASRFAGAASVLTLASLMASAPAHAAASTSSSSGSTDQFQHFVDCARWLLSDPAKHAKYCDPGHTVFVSSGGDAEFSSPG